MPFSSNAIWYLFSASPNARYTSGAKRYDTPAEQEIHPLLLGVATQCDMILASSLNGTASGSEEINTDWCAAGLILSFRHQRIYHLLGVK